MFLNDLGIYIPSLGRSSKVDKGPLVQIPNILHKQVYYIVPENEYKLYKETVPKKCNILYKGIPSGINKVRQWVIENAKEPYVFFIDDDTQFAYRNEEMKLRKCDKKQFTQMLIEIHKALTEENYVHVGVSARMVNFGTKEDRIEVGKMCNVYGMNRSILLKENIRFDEMEVMEDYNVILSLLKKGYPNLVLFNFAFGQRQSGEEGGCSVYRTWEMQKNAAHRLAELHPGCVKVVNKKTKTAWGNIGKSRVDVNVYWKKAYKPKRSKNEGVMAFFKGDK